MMTEQRLSAAMTAARQRVNDNQDQDGVAAALLWALARHSAMERVIEMVRQYLHSGQSAIDHEHLVRALEHLEQQERSAIAGEDHADRYLE